MIHSNTQLRTWATRAQTHMADELALYGIDESDVHLATITPAMVRSILAVVDIAPAPYVTPGPVLEYLTANPPFAPAATPTPVVEPVTPKLRRKSSDKTMPAVVARLQAIAVGGEMPTRVQYDAQRGSLPAASTLYVAGLKWPVLAEAAGLRITTPFERMQRGRDEQSAERRDNTDQFLADVGALLHSMAVDGVMPSQTEWDRSRPRYLPSNRAVRGRLGMEWSELAVRIGLKPNSGIEAMRALQRERAAQAQQPEPEAEAAVPAVPFRPAPSLSPAARGVLGPEHVVVTPHRNGSR